MAVTQTTDTIMAKIANLLARADHPLTPVAEATLAREQAERLMRRHRIEEAMLSDEQKAIQGIRPIRTEWIIGEATEFRDELLTLASGILRHIDAAFSVKMDWDNRTGAMRYLMDVFGFESDLIYGQMLFNAARLAFAEALEPRVNADLSDEDNVYRMRSAGMERNRIANALWGSAFNDGAAHGRVARLYKAACAARGDEAIASGKGFNSKVYRQSFADGFVSTMYSRLAHAAIAAGQDGHALVLQSRVDEVKEAFYAAYPHRRPGKAPALPNSGYKGRDECSKCAGTKSGYCREHAYLKPRAHRPQAHNHDAARHGRNIARTVNLNNGGTQIDR